MEVEDALVSTLDLIAEGVIEFAGFGAAAVSLVADDVLHTVAVRGPEAATAQLMDLRAPVELLQRELEPALTWGNLRFLPAGSGEGHLGDGQQWVPDISPLSVDDAWHPQDLLCGLLHDADGRLRGLVSVDLPINGRRPNREQRATLQMYVRLAERVLITALERGDLAVRVEQEQGIAEYRRRIVDTLSHELQGTAAAISNNVEIVRRTPLRDPLLDRALDGLALGARRVASVVDDMATLSRLVGRDRPAATSTDLGSVARNVLQMQGADAELKDVSVTLHDDGGGVVVGDANELESMVSNLVSNAVKYSDRGGSVLVSVVSDDARPDDTVTLTVSDTGIGIDDTDRKRIFEEFYRSSEGKVRQRSGTGLGLAIVEQVVTRHGGAIDVTSTPGRGSTFAVALPVRHLDGTQQ